MRSNTAVAACTARPLAEASHGPAAAHERIRARRNRLAVGSRSTISAAVPITVNQCNGTGNAGGTTVRVTRADGSVAVFTPNQVRRLHKPQFPAKLVYGNTTYAALRLITCGGPFDRASGHYLDNIIVLAMLVVPSRVPAASG